LIDSEVLKEIKKLKEDNKFIPFLNALPFRCIVSNDNGEQVIPGALSINNRDFNNLLNKNQDDLGKDVWLKWLGYVKEKVGIGNNSIDIGICLIQSEGENPTSEWINLKNGFKSVENISLKVAVTQKDNTTINIKNSSSKIILYDRHREVKRKYQSLDCHFYESFDKNSSDFAKFFAKPMEETVFQMIEAGLLRVLIMDERIAEKAYSYDKVIEDAYYAGLYICTHLSTDSKSDCRGVHSSIEKNKDGKSKSKIIVKLGMSEGSLCPKIEFKLKGREDGFTSIKGKVDVLIIHQGIMEIFLKDLYDNDYNPFILQMRKTIPYIVVDSGRGMPANLPDSSKFMPFSLLDQFIGTKEYGLAKSSLINFIMSLQRRGRG